MITIDGNSLTLTDVEEIAVRGVQVCLSDEAKERVIASRRLIEEILKSEQVSYGINTGFGKLSDVTIPADRLMELQLNLVRSHAVGLGNPLSLSEARAVLLLRANVLAKGHSGVRLVVLDTLLQMLNRGVTPVIPEKGSVGASGDLAPLAHLALVLIGEGEAFYAGERMAGGEAMARAGISTLVLEAKEGLALINGTQAMAALGSLLLMRARRLADLADLAGAMSLEALNGTSKAASPLIHNVRPHPGQKLVAERLLALTEGSEIMEAHRDCNRVQDAYSLRCIPQVHGAVRGAIEHVASVFEIELNSATDNPLVFAEVGEVISGGNFHGEPLALGLDYLAIALSELGALSERRIERLVNPDLSGLPAFLTPQPGTCSGFMIAQVCAVALQAENKVLAHPSSVDSLPTSANKEDHVSMGMTGALKLRTVVENLESILAIELLAAAQALDLHRPLRPGRGVEAAYRLIRTRVAFLEKDTVLSVLIERVRELLPELHALQK